MPRSLQVLWLALALALLGTGPAQANTLSVTYGSDPMEEVPTPVTATWTSAEASVRVIVTRKAGTRSCGATYAADDAFSADVINDLRASTGSTTNQMAAFQNPGALTLCGYLHRPSDGALLAATGPVPMTFRGGRASVTIEVPPRVTAGQIFPFVVPVYAELRRHVEVTIKPASARGCASSYPLDAPLSRDLMYFATQHSGRWTKRYKAPSVNGIYLLCAYVSERPSDPAPEARASATFEVGPDLCAAARAKLTAANRLARRAQSSVNRLRRTYRRYERRARRAEGATRRAYRRLARRDKRRYERAVLRRDASRQVVTTVQGEVTAACGGK